MTEIFRKAALDRLSTPERLDRALIVTRPRTWLVLVALGAMAAAAVVWSVKGEVSTFVQARGILLSHGGSVVEAVSSGVGTLTEIIPAVGDRVEKGAVLAEITNQEVGERYRGALELVEERAAALQEFKEASQAEDALIEQHVARQRERLRQVERSLRKSVDTARKRLENHRQLLEDHVVVRVTVERSQQAFDRAERDLFQTLRELDDLDSRELQRRNQYKSRVAEMEARLQAAERQAKELETRLDTQRVLAPVSGSITEIKATVGAILRAGQSVLSIKTDEGRLGALIYIPPDSGKRVQPGMEALVSPSTVRREEYGSLRGTVESVSAFPVSLDGMVAVLQNRSLAQAFSETGPPYVGRVLLVPDPSTASGFAWTSPKASGETLTTGTLAGIEVKVESQAPITLVVPLLRETFGL